MLILKAIQDKTSLFWGILAMTFVLFWPAILLRDFEVWFKTLIGLFPTNVGYPILAVLIGIYAALYVYIKRNKKVCFSCQPNKSGVFGGIAGVFLGACPACIPTIAFLLPLSLTVVLGYYSWIFLFSAIFFLIFSIWRMGGFKKVESHQN